MTPFGIRETDPIEDGDRDPDADVAEAFEAPDPPARPHRPALRQPRSRPASAVISAADRGSWWCQPDVQVDRSTFHATQAREHARMRASREARAIGPKLNFLP